MRNLKRALSLALASVMLLGMMVVGTSAASYPDVDAADNLEAIEVLKAVGVMTGDENGNFNPDSMVTRNEMAVVMTNLLGLTPGGTTPFTDVPAWAQPYVAACYNYGIIAGTSATTFGGSANVTAVQASLMVMKALGYFGFQGEFGDDWKLATVKQANVIDLYDGINAYTDKNMNRNDIAKMVLNALESDVMVVTEHGGLNVEGNGITVNQKPSYDYNTNAADRNNCNYNGVADGDLQLCEKLYGKDLKKNSDTTDSFNRPATQWSYKTKNITTPKAANITYTTAVKEKTVYADLGLNNNQSSLTVYLNGNDTALTTSATIGKTTSSDLAGTGNGVVTEIYLDDNKNVSVIVQYNEYLVKANEDYDAADANVAITVYSGVAGIAAITELKSEDFAMVADVKEDDYLLITVATADNGATYSVKSVKAAETVSDVKVSEYKASNYVVAGGTKYNYNATAKVDASALGRTTYMAGSYTLASTGYDLILDSTGYVIGVEPHSSDVKLGDYLFVKDATNSGFQYIAKVLFMDGTSKTVTVAKVKGNGGSPSMNAVSATGTGTTVANGTLSKECYYTFTTNKNGEYELTAVSSTRQVQGSDIDSTAPGFNSAQPVTGVSKTATNNTVFIAKDVVYTGVKNAPNLTGTPNVYCLLDDASGNNYILAAYADAVGASSTNASDYVYVIAGDATAKDENDKTYYVYDAVISGEKTTIKSVDGGKPSGLYEITSYSDGYAVLGTAITSTGGNVVLYDASVASSNISHKDGTVNVDGSSHVLDKDVLIYTIDARAGQSNAAKVITAGALNSLPTSASYIAWGIQVSASDSDLAALILVRTA